MLANVVEPSLDLAALALDEEMDAIMLGLQDIEEGLAECSFGRCALAGYGESSAGAGCGVMLDQVLEVVVVDIVFGSTSALHTRCSKQVWKVHLCTYNGSTREWTAAVAFRRISYPSVISTRRR